MNCTSSIFLRSTISALADTVMIDKLEQYIVERIGQRPQGLEHVLQCFKPMKVKRNEVLVNYGDTCKYCYFIVEGSLQIVTYDRNGETSTQDFATENQWLTAIRSFVNRQASNEVLCAIEHSQLLAISRDDFQYMVDNVPPFEMIYRSLLEQSYAKSIERVTTLLSMTAMEKLNWLLEREPLIFTRFSNRLIASYLGLTPETLSRLKANL
jgi:CRP-like cAMP-binding protein